MRTLVLALSVVLAGASQAMAQGLAGTSYSQTFSTASGFSRVVFKRTAAKGSADLDVFGLIDPCVAPALGIAGPGLEVDITNSLVFYGVTLAAPTAPWLTICPGYKRGTDHAFLDTGNCKIRMSVKWDDILRVVVHASVSASCSLPLPVAPTAGAYLQFVMSTPGGLEWHPMCFLSSGPYAAIVQKDGSDGKHVKMKTAPVCS